MVKMGTFRGIPVYVLQYSYEYQAIDSDEEKMYVCEGKLFYRGVAVGSVNGTQLTSFNEDKFKELRAKSWYQDKAEMLGRVTETAETHPQEEEKPEYEVPETGCGNSLVDKFLSSWKDNIDNEVAKLQLNIREMEAEICADYSDK